MGPLEIIVLILAPSFVAFIIGKYIYKRVKGIPTGECANCKLLKTSKELHKYYKQNKKNN